MKQFVILTLIVFTLYIVGFFREIAAFKWMDRSFTTAIKGFSILMVVWAHSGAKLGAEGIQFIAGIGVSLFLICSGYGLEMSYHKNGLKGFWKKRLLGVCLPFWIMELLGLIITQKFTVQKYALDLVFIKPATSYGWFMGYIVVCYFIFYTIKRFIPNEKINTAVLFGIFAAWFVIESLYFVRIDMPALRARQMLSFPCGVLIAQHKKELEQYLTKTKSALVFAGGGITCLLFMAITQLGAVKQLPYLVSNMLSLLTCFPMAIGIVALGKLFSRVFENKMFIAVGTISYEIYLVHACTLGIIKENTLSIALFLIVTVIAAVLLHQLMKMKDGLISK